MAIRRFALWFAIPAMLLLGGCRRNTANTESANTAPAAAASKAPVIDPTTAGSISGVVHFSGKAPERIKIDMSADPACAMSDTPNYTEQYVCDRKLLSHSYIFGLIHIYSHWSCLQTREPMGQ